MERFPASMIQEPTAFTSHDPMEIYNNILVFIVGKSGPSSDHNQRSEMHIFQVGLYKITMHVHFLSIFF